MSTLTRAPMVTEGNAEDKIGVVQGMLTLASFDAAFARNGTDPTGRSCECVWVFVFIWYFLCFFLWVLSETQNFGLGLKTQPKIITLSDAFEK